MGLIFEHTIQKVVQHLKTETRRIVQPDDEIVTPAGHTWRGSDFLSGKIVWTRPMAVKLIRRGGRIHWEVGRDYAAQPGRGQKECWRIEFTGIRVERLWWMSYESALREGVDASDCMGKYRGEFAHIFSFFDEKNQVEYRGGDPRKLVIRGFARIHDMDPDDQDTLNLPVYAIRWD